MNLGSTDFLQRLAKESGYIVMDADGKCWLKDAGGNAMQFVDGFGHHYSPELPRSIFDDFRKASLIRQDRDAPGELGLVFRLTADGIQRGTS